MKLCGRAGRRTPRDGGTGLACGAALLAVLIALVVRAPAAKAFPDYDLTIYGAAAGNSVAAQGLLRFMQLVEDRTNDRVQLSVYPFGSPDRAEEAVDDMHAGVLDMVLAPLSAFQRFHPKVQTWALPYLFHDREHLEEVIYGPVGRSFFPELLRSGIQGLAFWDGGFRHLATTDRPVGTLEDVEGLRLGVTDEGAAQVWAAFGAEPVMTAPGHLRAALGDGRVQGYGTTLRDLRAADPAQASVYVSLLGYAWDGYLLAVNPWVWKNLPVGIRQTIQEAALDAARWTAARWVWEEEEALRALEGAGVRFRSDPDVASFRDRAEELYRDWGEAPWFDRRLFAQIRALRKGD